MIPKDSSKDMVGMRAVVKVSVLKQPVLKPPNNNQIALKTIKCITKPMAHKAAQEVPENVPETPNKPPSPTPLQTTNSSCDDLTSLSWLNSLDMGGMVPHLAAPPTPPASPPLNSGGSNSSKRKVDPPKEGIDYSKDGASKPPFSYAALIGMAMKANGNKMTLSAIYKWIRENFAFYKTADPSWQVRSLL